MLLSRFARAPRRAASVVGALAFLCAACGGSSPTAPTTVGGTAHDGPWVGTWVQVNFLSIYDGGRWGSDDLSGIGFVQAVTPTEWIVTDDHGSGCAVTFQYTVDGNHRYVRRATGSRNGCLPGAVGLTETGRLEFQADGRFMVEHFDRQAGDELTAFKWMRR